MANIIIGLKDSKQVKYEINDLTKHAAVLGTTGSGKTVMCKVLIEEALLKGIPVIAIDPKGDISGLGIHDVNFDFRPFLSKSLAEKSAKKYLSMHKEKAPLFNHKTTVFTPKSNVGKQVSLMPDLSCPKNFSKVKDDSSIISALVEPLSDSIVSLAGITTNKDKVQTLIAHIVINSWSKQKDLSISNLIKEIINPNFTTIGSLPLEDFLKEKDRMKAASSINLLLSNPSKKVWSLGSPINSGDMLKKSSLSIFDLRFCHTQAEKQFVVEQILQDLYKFLLEKGGSQNLKYILYIDELAGLLPPPPSNPVSKKLLETLIRQARAFGLGIIVATQNPGDIDYKILGNIGSRFIGKLRTDNDVEKVASATDNKPSELKTIIGSLKTGEFYLNNSIRNKNLKFKTRWLYTLHEGPLKEREINWINNPKLKQKNVGNLNVSLSSIKQTKSQTKTQTKKSSAILSDNAIIRKGNKAQKANDVIMRVSLQKKRKNLQSLIGAVKKNVDVVNLNVALSKRDTTIYTPHLKLVVEPKTVKGLEFKTQGPFIFDLTSKAIPIHNYLKNRAWSQFVPENIEIEKTKASIKQVVSYTLNESKNNLKTDFFESKITNSASYNQDDLLDANRAYLEKLAKPRFERLNWSLSNQVKLLEREKSDVTKRIRQLKMKIAKKTASRAIVKIFSNKKLVDKTVEMKHWELRIKQLKKEVNKLNAKIFHRRKKHADEIKKLNDVIFHKSRTQIKKKIFRPTNKDLVIKATILLVPKRVSKK